VYSADLATLARSWILRAWFVLTVLVALVTMLDHGDPPPTSQNPGGVVLTALFHPVDTSTGEAHTLRELLKFYIVIWVSFIIVLTGGTVSSELGVLADSVLSRGISRWQYFLGKWSARLTAVLSVYLLVIVPTALVLWLSDVPAPREGVPVEQATFDADEATEAPGPLVLQSSLTLGGVAFALAEVTVILAFVVTCSIAFSASFGSTIISIGVGWISLYGTGIIFSILDFSIFSPARLLCDMPDLLRGQYVASDQYWQLGAWMVVTLSVTIISGVTFARRDV
jgi:ABC-type transport system involved in multi-copper enzyme maturation permease subunit